MGQFIYGKIPVNLLAGEVLGFVASIKGQVKLGQTPRQSMGQ
jgi:hypothetical protein